jgi:DNA-binding Xre family transcriptional regulator
VNDVPKMIDGLAKALGRKRGELNISVAELSRQTGVSRWTLDSILAGRSEMIHTETMNKLNSWLYQHV